MQALFALLKLKTGLYMPRTSMKPDFLTDVAIALASEADPERAGHARLHARPVRLHRRRHTERRGACRALLKTLKGEPLLEYARALWELPQREYQYVALDLLAMHWKELNTEDIPALLELVQDKSWWDTVDALAGIIGDVLRHRHDYMDECLRHNNFWMRRIALLHQLGLAK
jgi:3-methyladenine DNA glycosylase AlkD